MSDEFLSLLFIFTMPQFFARKNQGYLRRHRRTNLIEK